MLRKKIGLLWNSRLWVFEKNLQGFTREEGISRWWGVWLDTQTNSKYIYLGEHSPLDQVRFLDLPSYVMLNLPFFMMYFLLWAFPSTPVPTRPYTTGSPTSSLHHRKPNSIIPMWSCLQRRLDLWTTHQQPNFQSKFKIWLTSCFLSLYSPVH
jgi:hypothetical protein